MAEAFECDVCKKLKKGAPKGQASLRDYKPTRGYRKDENEDSQVFQLCESCFQLTKQVLTTLPEEMK